MSSFEYDPEQWYQNYIMRAKMVMTPELIFGNKFALAAEKRKPLKPVTLLSQMEKPFKVMFGKIPLTGFADTYCRVSKRKIGEYKTGVKKWDQKRVDDHGQITMYCLMNYIMHKMKPEDLKLFLEWVPTIKIQQENGDYSRFDYYIDFDPSYDKPVHFDTKRTMKQMLDFGSRINRTVLKMQEYVRNHQ
jgi:hypothetical protein